MTPGNQSPRDAFNAGLDEPDHGSAAAHDFAVTRAALASMLRAEPFVTKVCGECMTPTLADGEAALVSPGRAWPGDVVAVMTREGELLVHRYLGARPARGPGGHWYLASVTKPDHGERFDVETPGARVLGIVTGVRVSGDDTPSEGPVRAVGVSLGQRGAALLSFAKYLAQVAGKAWRRRWQAPTGVRR